MKIVKLEEGVYVVRSWGVWPIYREYLSTDLSYWYMESPTRINCLFGSYGAAKYGMDKYKKHRGIFSNAKVVKE